MIKPLAPFFLICATAMAGPLENRLESVIDYSESTYSTLATSVLSGNKEKFVNYTNTSGQWSTSSDGTWTSGFVAGAFWYLYDLTGDPLWKTRGLHWTDGLRSRELAADNDTGFQLMESFGMGYYSAPEMQQDYKEVLWGGAENLVKQRYNPTIGAFRSWEEKITNPNTLPFEVNIDQMMNLELVLWAAENGGPAEYTDYAVSHADKTWENNVRADGGTFHVVAYNADGSVNYKRTHQGWKEESTWSRGEAWAVYGYTMVYRFTQLPRMLERAEIAYDYFMTETRKDRSDLIPYSDFDAPIDSRNPRDTSAAAIVAAAAIELYEITGDVKYRNDAESILLSLTSDDYLSSGTAYQSLLLAASEKWGKGEVGAVFADFYLLEAIWRWKQLEVVDPVQTGTWAGFPVYDGFSVNTGSWFGWMDIAHQPYLYNYDLQGWVYLNEASVTSSGSWVYRFNNY